MSPLHEVEDDYKATEMSNVTATNFSTYANNQVVINTYSEYLLLVDWETEGHYFMLAIVINFLTVALLLTLFK